MAPSQPTFNDHIKELRVRILWVFLAVGLSAAIAYALRVPLIAILQKPLGAPLVYTSPAGSFNFVLKLSMVIGAFIALPVLLYHMLRFIEPALPTRISRGLMIKVIGSSFLLAVAGICFGFFLMIPMSLKFFLGYSSASIKPLITADEYLSFVLNHLLTFALAFQIPMIFLFINRIKPMKPSKLLRYQRHIVVGAFGLAIVLPFTYDPLSQFIVAIPIVFLYYFSVVLLWVVNRHQVYPEEVVEQKEPVPVTPMPVQATPVLAHTPQLLPRRPMTMDGFMPAHRPVAQTQTLNYVPTEQARQVKNASKTSPALSKPRLSIDGISPSLA